MVQITNRFMIASEVFVKKWYGQQAWHDVCATFEPSTNAIFKSKINPKKNVDFMHVAAVLKGVGDVLTPKNEKVLVDLGFHNSEFDLSATQRLLMKIISVEWVLKTAAILWKQRVINGGTIQIKSQGKGHVHATVRDFAEPMPQWWTYLGGWFACAITFSGGRNVDVQWTGGGSTPQDPAEYDARWQ